jgi:hypothetical protein
MSAFMGEVIGTMILIVFGAGIGAGSTLKHSYSNNAGWIVITISWGLAVTMGVFAVGSISGAHLNPAVTLAMAINGSFPWAEVPGYMAAQLIGAMIGAALVFLHYLPHWKDTADPAAKLGVFATGPAVPHTFSNFFSEMFGTFIIYRSKYFYRRFESDCSRSPGRRNRHVPWRHDRLCHQPGSGSRAEAGPFPSPDSGEREIQLGICVDSDSRPFVGRRIGSRILPGCLYRGILRSILGNYSCISCYTCLSVSGG